jgi:hypothetical protein
LIVCLFSASFFLCDKKKEKEKLSKILAFCFLSKKIQKKRKK